MSQQQVKKPLVSLLTLICFSLFLPCTTQAESPPCVSETLFPGEPIYRSTRAGVERDCFRIPVDGPGILEIYGSTGLRSERIRIAVDGDSDDEGGSSWRNRYRTPREWIVEMSGAGELALIIEAEIPGDPVPPYAVFNQFTAFTTDESDHPFDGRSKDVDPWDDDGTSGFSGGTSLPRGYAKDVDPWDDDGTSGFTGGTLSPRGYTKDVDPWDDDGTSGLVGEITVGRALGLCSQTDGDRPACARGITSGSDGSGEVFGEIQPGGEHHLTFALNHQQTVLLELEAGSAAGMQLYDSRGHALETSSTGWLVRTLATGRYYVLVTGTEPDATDNTSYALRLDRLP